ncbi:hypothetical protein ColLi_01526 [Colletotrichum liriopes]|uniref:Uncharacterized protein n=1 Tax=Colletotrichum liriopes TaxID=708192 RepID=A0AA37LNL7_9PEZI|nr:hypothetical protein ColLi_01526 [Colletotrichum liriopes]
MYQREYSVFEANITMLGCTLFSSIPDSKLTAVGNWLNDCGAIDGWTVEEHCQRHNEDFAWLNAMVKTTAEDPPRKIVILTLSQATACQQQPQARSFNGFARSTQLGQLPVKPWAFGHTHYTCVLADKGTGERAYTNQTGY